MRVSFSPRRTLQFWVRRAARFYPDGSFVRRTLRPAAKFVDFVTSMLFSFGGSLCQCCMRQFTWRLVVAVPFAGFCDSLLDFAAHTNSGWSVDFSVWSIIYLFPTVGSRFPCSQMPQHIRSLLVYCVYAVLALYACAPFWFHLLSFFVPCYCFSEDFCLTIHSVWLVVVRVWLSIAMSTIQWLLRNHRETS